MIPKNPTDGLDPSQGIMYGCCMSVIFWLVVIALAIALVRLMYM